MARDTTGKPAGGGARGPRRPADRRRLPAAGSGATGGPDDEQPWSAGLTGPQRAFPVWDGVPGYEFESRRPPPPARGEPGPPPPEEARRFRYTPTVSQPAPVPPVRSWDEQAWSRDERAAPGFEFDAPAPAKPRARAEWAGLLRSFLPEPVRRNWFAEFRSALHFRGVGTRVIIPIVAMMVFGVAVVVIAGANGSSPPGPAPPPAALGFPPATLAGADFGTADNGRGISQTLGQVTSDGAEIVAVGSQQGARIARAQFFVSTDGGRSWSMGHVRTPGGGPPPPGYAARFVAGGHGEWAAIGPRSIWTSPDGRTWTLSSTAGLPLRPGDQISVLERTAAGFIAAGSSVPDGSPADATPVIFLSASGSTWQRLGAAQLKLATSQNSRVLGIRYAAASGNQILIAGDVAPAAGQTPEPPTSAAWLSGNGGATWTLAVPPGAPAGHGAQAQISGVAVTADGFVLFRPATVARKPAVDVYRSASGTAWTFEATLGTPAGFVAGLASGAPSGGAVVTGQDQGSGQALIAFTSADGASWRRTAAFGSAAARDVSGVAMAEGGTVVTAGTTTDDPDSRQPLLTVLGPQAGPQDVDVTKIPGATDPELAVSDIAAGHGMQVAVGSANGYPAAWTSANGGSSWTRASGQTQAVLDRPGVQQLTSVTFGADGWLAVGGVIAVAAQHPGGPRLGQRQRLDRRRPRGGLQPARPVHRAGGRGPLRSRLRHRRLSGRRGPHHRRGLVVRGPDRVAARRHPLGRPPGASGRCWASPRARAGSSRSARTATRPRPGPPPTAAASGPSRTSRCRSAPPGPCSSTSPAAAVPWSRWAPRSPPRASSCRSRRARPTAAPPGPSPPCRFRPGARSSPRSPRSPGSGRAGAGAGGFLATGTFGSTARPPGRGGVDLGQRIVLEGGHAGRAGPDRTGHPGHHRPHRLRPHPVRRRLHRHARRRAARPLAVTGPLGRVDEAAEAASERTGGPNTSSRRLARLGTVARTVSTSPVSTSPTATPAAGPRSRRTTPSGSTSMLRPTPVAARVGGSAGSGTCPTAATHTVFSMARARTRVTQCSSLNGPAAHAAGSTRSKRPGHGQRPGQLAEPHVVADLQPGPHPGQRAQRPAPTPARPARTPGARTRRTGAASGTRPPAPRDRQTPPRCCTPGRPARARTPRPPAPPRSPWPPPPAPSRTARPAARPPPAGPSRT